MPQVKDVCTDMQVHIYEEDAVFAFIWKEIAVCAYTCM